jgi:hypothetical protein
MLGGLTYTCPNGLTVISLADSITLSYRLSSLNVMKLSLLLKTLDGRKVLEIEDGDVIRDAEPPLRYREVAGHIQLTVPPTSNYVPPWLLEQLQEVEPTYESGGLITLLDLEVVEPGLAAIQGTWAQPLDAIVVGRDWLRYFRVGQGHATLRGATAVVSTKGIPSGVIDRALIGVGEDGISVGRGSGLTITING